MTKKSILIVEDDQYIRDLYSDLLTEADFSVTQAIDGQEGFLKLKSAKFDLILLDIMMPNMGGIDVLKALKKNQKKHKLGPIIMLTNLSHNTIIDEAIQLGATSYLTKSELTPQEFVEKIKSFLK